MFIYVCVKSPVLVDCGDPDPPANGTVTTPTGTEFGHPAIYACDDDFVLSSCEIRTCLYTGVWSGIAPTCDPIRKCKNIQ